MKQLCVVLCLLFMSSFLKGQARPKSLDLGNIVSDPASVNNDLAARFGLGAVAGSAAVIEIRLYSGLGFPGAQCVVLSYDKAWKATSYKLNARDSAIRTPLKPAVGVESIARAVIAKPVFALTSQQHLDAGKYTLNLQTNTVKASAMQPSDSPCYIVQFKAGAHSREYQYCDPKAYAAFYKGQHEYSDFAAILKAFARLEMN